MPVSELYNEAEVVGSNEYKEFVASEAFKQLKTTLECEPVEPGKCLCIRVPFQGCSPETMKPVLQAGDVAFAQVCDKQPDTTFESWYEDDVTVVYEIYKYSVTDEKAEVVLPCRRCGYETILDMPEAKLIADCHACSDEELREHSQLLGSAFLVVNRDILRRSMVENENIDYKTQLKLMHKVKAIERVRNCVLEVAVGRGLRWAVENVYEGEFIGQC